MRVQFNLFDRLFFSLPAFGRKDRFKNLIVGVWREFVCNLRETLEHGKRFDGAFSFSCERAGAEACARDLGRKQQWDKWARGCSELDGPTKADALLLINTGPARAM